MKLKESLYIRILVWAYEQQEAGFTWEDLTNEFKLNNKQLQWVQKIFRSNMPSSENLIDHLFYQNDEHTFVITAKGTSAAVQYLNLKEAERSGKRAEYIAWTAISVGVIVGAIQIIIGFLQLK
ncbi:MAG: hypothetical protein A2664_04315 [Candidatus Taylorbacteria bacterium RIFCSPHIGHO2_01_FULL_46_22b]|uniref:Uncharacterized protein n=1 Tax=Candidatus Taylorbacteria bacterium RIFCSPHIGHO2_01_FULL_46_22b TaxID=1802301 RepID=A0A1G2M1N0_9BACT|nr:MAG: hypothetical protein A2664_04315 [Candidatus Taylorbacteria bacterium RIFCSPHIGHO2_01_FULL_46_22b]